MADARSNDDVRLGFLRVVETDAGGFAGGILVTNRLGRPLEFQCTTPVKPNPMQVILYGATLRPFICSELIGRTLHERLNVKPQLLLIDQDELLPLREHVAPPIGCLLVEPDAAADLADETRLSLGGRTLRFHPEHPDDKEAVRGLLTDVPRDADLGEPLVRVGEALAETLRPAA